MSLIPVIDPTVFLLLKTRFLWHAQRTVKLMRQVAMMPKPWSRIAV